MKVLEHMRRTLREIKDMNKRRLQLADGSPSTSEQPAWLRSHTVEHSMGRAIAFTNR